MRVHRPKPHSSHDTSTRRWWSTVFLQKNRWLGYRKRKGLGLLQLAIGRDSRFDKVFQLGSSIFKGKALNGKRQKETDFFLILHGKSCCSSVWIHGRTSAFGIGRNIGKVVGNGDLAVIVEVDKLFHFSVVVSDI